MSRAQGQRNWDTAFKAHRVMAFIEDYWRREGHSPSYREIKAGCCLSSISVVGYWINLLESWGFLSREPGLTRVLVPHNLGT